MKRFYLASKVIRELQLSSKAINVYDYLCMCVNKDSECFPGKKKIGVQCSISVASVTRALRELEKAKMIETIARFEPHKHNRQTSNIYHVYETPQIDIAEASSLEPLDAPIAELVKVSEQVEICACASLQDKSIATALKLDNAVGNEPSPTLSAQPFAKAIPQSHDDAIIASTDTLEAETANRKNLVTYFIFSAFLLVKTIFLRASQPDFDTPPHVTVIHHGTRTKRKVTDNFRRENTFTKLTKRYKLHKYTKLAG